MQSIITKYGELIPQHTTDDLRKKELLPTVFYANGTPKSLPLENQTTIVTSLGDISAELVTFHENGSINRVFPLNGKLSGYWTEADELAMAKPVVLRTPAGTIAARTISIGFYDNEALRSITLCPGETVSVSTKAGKLEARIGISFSLDGTLKSLEPAMPTTIETIIGEIMAYDPDAVGVNGDSNSLAFDDNGDIASVTTTLSRLKVVEPSGNTSYFTPEYRESYCSDSEQEIIPMTVNFSELDILISTNPKSPSTHITKEQHKLSSEPYLPQLANGLGSMNCSI
ncbi:MAG: hypothetical protein OCC46_14855 [Pseudodesulfovibrio sp.]